MGPKTTRTPCYRNAEGTGKCWQIHYHSQAAENCWLVVQVKSTRAHHLFRLNDLLSSVYLSALISAAQVLAPTRSPKNRHSLYGLPSTSRELRGCTR
jgi:hypothetical protein